MRRKLNKRMVGNQANKNKKINTCTEKTGPDEALGLSVT